jgi:predicted porin
MEIYRMKKSLLAVAAMTAFAGAAQAQSSVTVYGILDVGAYGGTQKTGGTSASASNGLQFGESAEQTSRLGFKGTEDLGGGRQALFTAEFQLFPTDASLSGNSVGSGLVNRQTFVGLHQNGVGTATIGTQYTGIFDEVAATDAGQLNNVAGNLIYAVGGVSGSQNAQQANGADGIAGSNVGFTTRTTNTLKLQSDSFKGFRVNGSFVMNDSNTIQTTTATATTGGMVNQNGWGLGFDYTLNKFYATAQYQSLMQKTTATSTVDGYGFVGAGMGLIKIAPAANLTGTPAYEYNPTQGINTRDNQWYAAATYDFGILKAYAQYVNRKWSSVEDSTYYANRSAEQIGVRSFITPTIEGWASAGLGRVTAYGQGSPTANFNGWQLGSNYWLSKRTNLYAIYGNTNTSNSAAATGNGTATFSQNAQQYAVGIRHTF